MLRYLARAFTAHFRAGRTLFVLTLLGVALGVASVISIQILNRNALGAFEGSVKAVSGEADLSVLPRAATMPDGLVAEVLAVEGVDAAFPLHRVEVAVPGDEGTFLEIVGVDMFSAPRVPWQGDRPPADLSEVLAEPGWAAVTPEMARERGWTPGSRFEVASGGRRVELRVGALVDFRRLSPLASRRLVVMDIAQVQSLFGGSGELHQIDVEAKPGIDVTALRARLGARLGDGAEVVTPEQRRERASGLLDAFRLNLTALSLISLFVGGFLIYASTQASLARRRTELGLLRSIGATPRQVLALILAEVAVLGAGGTLLGLALGYAAASTSVETVSATLSNLYMLEEIETLALPVWIFVLAAAIGAGGVVAGAAGPALEMVRRDTRALLAAFTLHERVGAASGRLMAAGAFVATAAGIFALAVGDRWRWAGFVVAVAILVAAPLFAPRLVAAIGRLHVTGFSIAYGVRTLGARAGVTAFATAALAVAVTMLVGITVMIGSFRRTVEIWIGQTLRADVYVTSESWPRSRGASALGREVEAVLAGLPGVRGIDRLRQETTTSGGRRIVVGGADLADLPGVKRFELLEGDEAETWRRVREEGAVLVSEPLARKAGLGVGDRLVIAGRSGEVAFPVAGVIYDYSSDAGGVLMSLENLDRTFGPRPVTNVALFLEPDVGAEATVDRVKATLPDAPLRIRSNRTLREEVFRIFDQTFAVTRLLQAMSLLIAACGIALTLLILARERVSELALYRALGASRRQIFRVFLGKGIGIAALGLVLGAAAGAALALVLVFMINRAWFGWTIALHWPWGALARQAGTILVAAVAASIYPAIRASRTPATELSRDDL